MRSNKRRIAGFCIIRVDADKWASAPYRDEIFALIDEGIGGIGVFSGTLEASIEMIDELQLRANGRLLVAADHEFGLPMRISEGGIAFPRAMALGQTLPGITQHVAKSIAKEQRAMGVHWNWAPVADVNSDPQNPVINTRSFGSDVAVVTQHVEAFVKGLQDHGVMACLKHAPGHGDTTVDSHEDLPTLSVDLDALRERELVPFHAGIRAGAGSIMMGHLQMTALDAELPASLSAEVVGNIVRKELAFDGLVVTDALDMGAITKNYSSGEAATLAFKAGCDAILMPADTNKAIDALVEATERGEISEDRLEASERRWAVVRDRYLQPRSTEPIDQSTHAMIALKSADGAIRLKGDVDLLPILDKRQVAAFAVVNEVDTESATTWFHYLAQATELNIDFGFIDGTIEERDLQGLMEGVVDAELVIFAFFGKAVSQNTHIPGFDRVPAIMDALSHGKKRAIVACGSPYGIETLNADMYLYTYSDTVPSLAASVLRLIGRNPE